MRSIGANGVEVVRFSLTSALLLARACARPASRTTPWREWLGHLEPTVRRAGAQSSAGRQCRPEGSQRRNRPGRPFPCCPQRDELLRFVANLSRDCGSSISDSRTLAATPQTDCTTKRGAGGCWVRRMRQGLIVRTHGHAIESPSGARAPGRNRRTFALPSPSVVAGPA